MRNTFTKRMKNMKTTERTFDAVTFYAPTMRQIEREFIQNDKRRNIGILQK